MPVAKLTSQFISKANCPEGKGKVEFFDHRQ